LYSKLGLRSFKTYFKCPEATQFMLATETWHNANAQNQCKKKWLFT